MDLHLISMLVCPQCKARLNYDKSAQELICVAEHLAFPINDGVPCMMVSLARDASGDEKKSDTDALGSFGVKND